MKFKRYMSAICVILALSMVPVSGFAVEEDVTTETVETVETEIDAVEEKALELGISTDRLLEIADILGKSPEEVELADIDSLSGEEDAETDQSLTDKGGTEIYDYSDENTDERKVFEDYSVDTKNGLVSYWSFDDEGRTVFDPVSGNDGELIRGLVGVYDDQLRGDYLIEGQASKTADGLPITWDNQHFTEDAPYSMDGYAKRMRRRRGNALEKSLSLGNAGAYVDVKENTNLPIASKDEYSISFWVKGAGRNGRNNQIIFIERGDKASIKFQTVYNGEGQKPADYAERGIGYSYWSNINVIITDDTGKVVLKQESEPFMDGSWHYVTWVDKNGEAAFYIDGVKDEHDFNYDRSGGLTLKETIFGTPADTMKFTKENPGDVNIRNRYDFFYGHIDNVSMYDRCLNPAEIKTLYYHEDLDLMAHFRFENNLEDERGHVYLENKDVEYEKGINKQSVKASNVFDLGNHPSLDTGAAFSYALWYNGGDNAVLFEKQDSFKMHVKDKKLVFEFKDSAGQTLAVTSDKDIPSTWTHLAVSCDGVKAKIYIDAVESGVIDCLGLIESNKNIIVGNESNTGYIDDVKVYSYGMTQTDLNLIQELQPEYIKEMAEKLKNILKLDHKDMAEVKAAYARNDYEGALELYKQYYIKQCIEQMDVVSTELGSDGTAGEYGLDTEYLLYSYTFVKPAVPVSVLTFERIGEPGEMDFTWLNRQADLMPLYGSGSWYRGLFIYSNFIDESIQTAKRSPNNEDAFELYYITSANWVKTEPYNSFKYKDEITKATGAWTFTTPNVMAAVITYPTSQTPYMVSLNPEFAEKYLAATDVAARALQIDACVPYITGQSSTSNHQLSQKSELLKHAILYNTLKCVDDIMLDINRYILGITIKRAVAKDGTTTEYTWHYNNSIITTFNSLLKGMKNVYGDEEPYIMKAMRETAVKTQRWLMASKAPWDDQLPPLGHSGGYRSFPKSSEHYVASPVFDWIGHVQVRTPFEDTLTNQVYDTFTGGESEPYFTSMAFPYGGTYIMRSSWDEDAQYAFFKGTHAFSKSCDDTNSIDIAGYGRRLIAKCGAIQTGIQAEYFNSVYGNNTIAVDGYTQKGYEEGLGEKYNNGVFDIYNNRWHTSENFDFAEGKTQDGFTKHGTAGVSAELNRVNKDKEAAGIVVPVKPINKYDDEAITDVEHQRQVMSLREKGIYVITDRLLAASDNVNHEYTQIWNFDRSFAEDSFTIDEEKAVTSDDKGANVAVYEFTSDELELEKYYGFYEVREGGERFARGWSCDGVIDMLSGNESMDVNYKWRGSGDQAIVSLIAVSPDKEEIVTKRENISSDNGIRGFKAELRDGTKIQYLAGVKSSKLDLDKVSITGKNLLVTDEGNGVIKGIALDVKDFYIGGSKMNVSYDSFEFVYDGTDLKITPIEIPQTFKWIEDGEKVVPSYKNYDFTKGTED